MPRFAGAKGAGDLNVVASQSIDLRSRRSVQDGAFVRDAVDWLDEEKTIAWSLAMSASVIPAALEALRRELDRAEEQLRPLSKVRLNPRDELRSTARASFVDAVDSLRGDGWSQNAICDALGVDIRTFLDWLEGKRQLPAWAIAALPQSGRVVFLKAALGWPEGKAGR